MIAAGGHMSGGLRDYLTAGFDRSWQRVSFFFVFALALFLYPFGLLFVAGGLLPDRFSWTASVVIVLNGVATLLSEMRVASPSRVIWTAVILTALLFGVELLGVRTGFPFGRYVYTDVLGFRIFEVPAAISLAWYTTIVLTWRIAEGLAGARSHARLWSVCLGAALLTVALDLSLEAMAASIRMYWRWEEGAVPLQNYATWFGVTLVAVYLLARRMPSPEVKRGPLVLFAAILYTMQWILFSLTAVAHGAPNPVLVGAGMLLLVLLAFGWSADRKIRIGVTRRED